MKRVLLLSLLSLAVVGVSQTAAPRNQFAFDGKTWWDYVKVIAYDIWKAAKPEAKV